MRPIPAKLAIQYPHMSKEQQQEALRHLAIIREAERRGLRNPQVDTSKADVISHGMALKAKAEGIAKNREGETYVINNFSAEELAEVASDLGFTEDFSGITASVSREDEGQGSPSASNPSSTAHRNTCETYTSETGLEPDAITGRGQDQGGVSGESQVPRFEGTANDENISRSIDGDAATFAGIVGSIRDAIKRGEELRSGGTTAQTIKRQTEIVREWAKPTDQIE